MVSELGISHTFRHDTGTYICLHLVLLQIFQYIFNNKKMKLNENYFAEFYELNQMHVFHSQIRRVSVFGK